MAVLPDYEIEEFCRADEPLITPFAPEQLQPASYDVRLADTLLVPPEDAPYDLGAFPYELQWLHFVLGSTVEWVDVPNDMVARIEGKSTLARQGLQIHSAGYLDPGFQGNVTLEIVNFRPEPGTIDAGMLIAQLSFEYLSSPCRKPYSGRYQRSEGTVAARS